MIHLGLSLIVINICLEVFTTGVHDPDMMASFLSFPPEIRVQIYRELLQVENLEDPGQVITDFMDWNLLHTSTSAVASCHSSI